MLLVVIDGLLRGHFRACLGKRRSSREASRHFGHGLRGRGLRGCLLLLLLHVC